MIIVIAILVSLLLPALSRAKASAQRTACANNLHQISMGVRMYSDDSQDASPSLGGTNIPTLYSGYKALMKSYIGANGQSSSQDKVFACPADNFYPNFVFTNQTPSVWNNVQSCLHDQPFLDFSSYAFNGGNNVAEPLRIGAITRPGLTGVKVSAVKYPSRTVLVVEASAIVPWSWHQPSPQLIFNDAKNIVSYVDGHVSYINIYRDENTNNWPWHFYASLCDPPASYDYQWSPN